MSSDAPRRISALEVWIELPPTLDEKQRRTLQRAAETCPVKLSLSGAVPMTLHW